MIDDILRQYPNDVKFVFKHYPLSFHKQAKQATLYALAAERQGKYKEMYHAIFENYKLLKSDEDYPVKLAEELGLDVEQFKKDANDPAIDAQIEKEFNQMKNSGIPRMSVPKFLVAGKEPQGRDIGTFSAMIDAALKKK